MTPQNDFFALPKLFSKLRNTLSVLFAEKAEHGIVLDASAVSRVVVHYHRKAVVRKKFGCFNVAVGVLRHAVNYLNNALYVFVRRLNGLHENIRVARV